MVAAGLPVTSVIRIQISVCTSQDIGAPKRAINRDTLLVRENSIYVKKTRHPMIDSRNISRYRFLLPSRPNFLFSSVSRLLARIQTNFSYRRSLFESRSKVNTCVCTVYDGATKEKRTMGSFLPSILCFFPVHIPRANISDA